MIPLDDRPHPLDRLALRGAPEAAAIEDREPRAALGFVHIVSRDQQRRALIGKLEQGVPELAPRLRIEKDELIVPDGPGLGVHVDPARLEQYRI